MNFKIQPLNQWRYKLIIMTTSIGLGLGAFFGNIVFLKYKSDAVLSLEMTVPEYKRFSEAISSRANASELMKVIPVDGLDKAIIFNEIATYTNSSSNKWLTPLPKLNKAEAKDLPDSLQKIALESESSNFKIDNNNLNNLNNSNNSNNINIKNNLEKIPGIVYMGVKISETAPSSEQAARLVAWLSNYFKEVATKEAVREQLFVWIAENNQINEKVQSQQFKYLFDIEQVQVRAAALKRLMTQYPESVKTDNRQLLEIRKETEKFISISTQMLGAEAELIDIREKLARLQREQEQYQLATTYLQQVETAFNATKTGTLAVKALKDLTNHHLSQAHTDAEKEIILTYAADISKISARFLSQAQLIVPPSMPEYPEQPRPLIWTLLLGLLGLMLGVGYIFKTQLMRLLTQIKTQALENEPNKPVEPVEPVVK